MDTGNGRFELAQGVDEDDLKIKMSLLESKYPNHGGWFREGEIIELRGSTFKVTSIKPTGLRLKLIKRA